MKKNTLRFLGIGFLLAAILTALFAIFVQGNTPVEGITVNSLLGSNNEEEIAQYEEQISSLASENESLDNTRNTLNESIAQFSERETEYDNTVESLEDQISSLEAQLTDPNTEDETTEVEEETTDEPEETTEEPETSPTTEGSFTISDGESSSEIAGRLEEEGIIESAGELETLIDDWGLEAVIQAGDYELDPEMSIDEIATIITNGAYYYN